MRLLLLVVLASVSVGCMPRQAATTDSRQIVAGLYAICDAETKNLVYFTSNGGVAVVQDGCK